MQFPFVGGSYEGRSKDINSQRCVNLYVEVDQQGGKVPIALFGTPGLVEFCDTGIDFALRGMHVFDGVLYAVCGSSLYGIDTTGTATYLGALNTLTGPVYMANNPTQLMIVDSTYGYIWDGTTVTQIADTDFMGAGGLTYQDGYFIVPVPDTIYAQLSDLNDGTSWDPTQLISVEGKPDSILAVFSDHRELWAFKKQTTEVYYNSGGTVPFTRKIDEILERGIIAPASVAREDNTIFWLDDRGIARRAEGYNPKIISTRHIEYQWSQYDTLSDAIGFCYVQEGHTFYVLTFPGANKTWCYDITTGIWHERMSSFDYVDGRWRANCYAYFDGKHLVGDYANGKIYEMSLDTYADDGEPIKAIRRAPVVHDDRKWLFHRNLEIEFESGVGLVSGQGQTPYAMLRWSDDGGHTWGNVHPVEIGKIGEYTKRARWKKLGRSRNRIYEVTITDPVKRVIVGAYLDVEKGVS